MRTGRVGDYVSDEGLDEGIDEASRARSGRSGASLAELLPGVHAVVVGVCAAEDRATARRLEDLGFSPGTPVEVMRRAPLRDPVVYRLRGYDICLRRAQAGMIRVAAAS